MPTLFNDPHAKEKVRQLYLEKLDELALPNESLQVETSFGNTHILIAGPKDRPPLVLLHGANGCAPVALEALKGLTDHFRIYAVDVVGQPNLSSEIRPSMKGADYGMWIYELLARLDLSQVILVGISFGGFICWKTLVFDQTRISRAFLIVPAGIVNGNPLRALLRVFLPMKLYRLTKNIRHLRKVVSALFSEHDSFAMTFLSEVFLHFNMDFSPVPLIKPEEAKRITRPVHLVGAGNDVFFPGAKVLERMRKIFPSHSECLLLPESRHVPGTADNELITAFILKNT